MGDHVRQRERERDTALRKAKWSGTKTPAHSVTAPIYALILNTNMGEAYLSSNSYFGQRGGLVILFSLIMATCFALILVHICYKGVADIYKCILLNYMR